ncbi:MAG: hypothetical protein VZR27_04520 [Acutalibacteraceae bacterium]|nr:hypothetical protein [Acutalibacteraceae bacterium]
MAGNDYDKSEIDRTLDEYVAREVVKHYGADAVSKVSVTNKEAPRPRRKGRLYSFLSMVCAVMFLTGVTVLSGVLFTRDIPVSSVNNDNSDSEYIFGTDSAVSSITEAESDTADNDRSEGKVTSSSKPESKAESSKAESKTAESSKTESKKTESGTTTSKATESSTTTSKTTESSTTASKAAESGRAESKAAESDTQTDSETAESDTQTDSETAGSDTQTDSETAESDTQTDSDTAESDTQTDSDTAESDTQTDSETAESDTQTDSEKNTLLSRPEAYTLPERESGEIIEYTEMISPETNPYDSVVTGRKIRAGVGISLMSMSFIMVIILNKLREKDVI